MTQIIRILVVVVTASVMFATVSLAHFGMIIPSKDVVGKDDPREISLTLQFTHPFEGGPQMDLLKPEKFGVVVEDKLTDLTGTLKEKKVEGKSTWETYVQDAPGRPITSFSCSRSLTGSLLEDKFIIHFTKVIVDALGAEAGWDKPIAKAAGIPVEIVPTFKTLQPLCRQFVYRSNIPGWQTCAARGS